MFIRILLVAFTMYTMGGMSMGYDDSGGGHSSSIMESKEIPEVGMRVKRGRDWEWDDQDGDEVVGYDLYLYISLSLPYLMAVKGVVLGIVRWKGERDPLKIGVRVRWIGYGVVNTYRWGAMDKYDLQIVSWPSSSGGGPNSTCNLTSLTEENQRVEEKINGEMNEYHIPLHGDEMKVLMDLYLSTGGDKTWRSRDGWETISTGLGDSDPCRDGWTGVVCRNGHVFSLDLSSNGLEGPLPSNLSLLTHLTTLNLSGNRLHGPIPKDLYSTTHLTWLALHDNSLSGRLDDDIGRWKEIRWISLYNNFLHGPLPPSIVSCGSLTTLSLNNNNLSGEIPEGLWNLENLTDIYLQRNSFTGVLPVDRIQLLGGGGGGRLVNVRLKPNKFISPAPTCTGGVCSIL